MPSVTAGTIMAFNGAFTSDGSVNQAPLVSPSVGGSQLQLAAPLTSAASTANFASIDAAPFGAMGGSTFAPRSTGGSGGSVQIADAGPGGSGAALTMRRTDAANSLETIGTSRSAPLGDQTPALMTGSAPAIPSQVPQSGTSVYVVSGGLSTLMAAPLAANSASSASFGYSFAPSGVGTGSPYGWSPNGGPARAGLSASGSAGTSAPGRVIAQPSSATGSFAANGVTFASNGHTSNRHALASGANVSGATVLSSGSGSTLGYSYTPISARPAAVPTLLASSSVAAPQMAFASRSGPGGGPGNGPGGGPGNGPGAGANPPPSGPPQIAATTSGSVFSSSIVGSGVTDTPVAVPNGAIGAPSSTINFGTIALGSTETLDLALQNVGTNPNGSVLTIEGYSITGTDASSFSASLTAGSVIDQGGTLIVPITVYATRVGELTSNLTLFTDQGAGLGGAGATFTYSLDPTSSPEPASIAVIGVGLAGLANMRRRRRQIA